MGHDIIAGQFTEQQLERIRNQLNQPVFTMEQWAQRFDGCGAEHWAATLRRTSYDKYNKVIYRALDAEEFYTGCSGNAEVRSFSLLEIKLAQKLLPSIVADAPPPIDTAQVDEMKAALELIFRDADTTGFEAADNADTPGVEEEAKFLDDVLEWMNTNEKEDVEVYFG